MSTVALNRNTAIGIVAKKIGSGTAPAGRETIAKRLGINRTTLYKIVAGQSPGLGVDACTGLLQLSMTGEEWRSVLHLFTAGVVAMFDLLRTNKFPIGDLKVAADTDERFKEIMASFSVKIDDLASMGGINRTTLLNQRKQHHLNIDVAAPIAGNLITRQGRGSECRVLTLLVGVLHGDMLEVFKRALIDSESPGDAPSPGDRQGETDDEPRGEPSAGLSLDPGPGACPAEPKSTVSSSRPLTSEDSSEPPDRIDPPPSAPAISRPTVSAAARPSMPPPVRCACQGRQPVAARPHQIPDFSHGGSGFRDVGAIGDLHVYCLMTDPTALLFVGPGSPPAITPTGSLADVSNPRFVVGHQQVRIIRRRSGEGESLHLDILVGAQQAVYICEHEGVEMTGRLRTPHAEPVNA